MSLMGRYRRFSNPKSRAVDQQFIDLFDLSLVWDEVDSPKGGGLENLPQWPMLRIPRARKKPVQVDDALGDCADHSFRALDLLKVPDPSSCEDGIK